MLSVTILAVGKLKEKFYTEATLEYQKRLGAFCSLEMKELPESDPKKEAELILAQIPKGAYVIALCIEGEQVSSEDLAKKIEQICMTKSKLCFIIGGSVGLHETIKQAADFRLSFSRMTFPHHLFRVMLLEQIYRAFQITKKAEYHK